jgi:hypothetical protein
LQSAANFAAFAFRNYPTCKSINGITARPNLPQKGKATFEVTTILQPRRTSIPFDWCAMVYSQNHPGATWSQSFEPCIPGDLK